MTSTTMLWIVLLIIVVVAGTFLGFALQVRKLNTRFDELMNRLTDIKAIPMTEKMDEIKKMHLNGQSKEIVEGWEERHEQTLEEIKSVEADFSELAESIDGYSNIKHSKQFLEYLDGKLLDLADHVNEVFNGLQSLQDNEQKNSERIQASVDNLEALKTRLDENGTDFGVALGELKKQFKHVSETFDQFYNLNENGDPVEATQVLKKAEKEVAAAQKMFDVIPALNEDLDHIFAEQIDDLSDGYRRLVDDQYKFDGRIDIASALKELKEMRQSLLESLKRCDLDVVESGNRQMKAQIDRLYDYMQREVDAQVYVSSNQMVVADFLSHAYKNNRQLSIELDRTAQSFTFHNNEIGRVRAFQSEIEAMQRDNDTWNNELLQHNAIYSEVAIFYEKTLNVLEDIENQQVEMDQTIKEMHEALAKAENAFDEFDFNMRYYKRYVERHRLPGLPQDYLDYFFLVSDHIESLGAELAKIRVDTDRLTEYVTHIREEVSQIAKQTNTLIDSASLAEQFLQYANRYRTSHQIGPTIDESMDLFRRYQYVESMNTIRTYLANIDPEAVKRIEDYYKEEHEGVE